MAKGTKIQWCDSTFNPWIGCKKVSEGCRNCYAEALNNRHGWVLSDGGSPSDPTEVEPFWGGSARRRTSAANWKKPLKWNEVSRRNEMAVEVGREPTSPPVCQHIWNARLVGIRRPRVFCGSLCDWLDPDVPVEWLADLLTLIAETPHLDWLLLTKRIELWNSRIVEARDWLQTTRQGDASGSPHDVAEGMCNAWIQGVPPHNVWLGTTTENQAMADKRIPELLRIPARVRFLSVEPMLGPLNFRKIKTLMQTFNAQPYGWHSWLKKGLHWVIAGCESGPNRRPMKTEWALELRHHCAEAGIPFFMKQMEVGGKVTSDLSLFPAELQVREFPEVKP
jgi:protein gp37